MNNPRTRVRSRAHSWRAHSAFNSDALIRALAMRCGTLALIINADRSHAANALLGIRMFAVG
jgi:hypothetical protein